MIALVLIIFILVLLYLISVPAQKEHFAIASLKEHLGKIDPVFETFDIREGTSSYTEDKSIIYICLYDEHGKMYPMNTLVYVTLHEASHVMNKSDYGHTAAFYKIFDKLLCKAAALGVYDPSQPHVKTYCGVDISGIKMPTCTAEHLE